MDDVVIEDDIDLNEQTNFEEPSKLAFFLENQWAVAIVISGLILLIFLAFRSRRRIPRSSGTKLNSEESISQYEKMREAREKQQMAYEQHRLAQQEKEREKAEKRLAAAVDNHERVKYRSDDHNPLTGQSSRDSNNSCSWRPSSSRRRPAAGG